MAHQFSFQRHIRAPRPRVFDALIDIEHARDWLPNLVSLERVDGRPGEAGDTRKEVRRMYGREATEFIKITDVRKPGRIDMYTDGSEGSTGRGDFFFTYWLDQAGPQANETKLTLDCRIEDMGWVGSLFLRLFSGTFERAMAEDLDALASYVESTTRRAA